MRMLSFFLARTALSTPPVSFFPPQAVWDLLFFRTWTGVISGSWVFCFYLLYKGAGKQTSGTRIPNLKLRGAALEGRLARRGRLKIIRGMREESMRDLNSVENERENVRSERGNKTAVKRASGS